MPVTSALPQTAPPLPALPPALQTALDGIVNMLVIETVFPTLLIPLAVCLFMFTKPDIKKKPVFILNAASVILGLVYGGIAIAAVSRTAAGHEVAPEFITALTGLYFFIPLCVQCILFVRIFAVYPPLRISRLLAVTIYGTLFALTLTRVVNVGIALKKINDDTRVAGNNLGLGSVGRTIPSITAELSMGLVYDIIASSLFLFRLQRGGALRSPSPTEKVVMTSGARMSYPARLRALFWIASTNFILPVVFNILLIILFRLDNSGPIINERGIAVIAVVSVNVYVQIVSGLLATLWCHAGSYRRETAASPRESPMAETVSALKFAPGPSTSTFAPSSTLASRIHVEVEALSGSGAGDQFI